MRAFENLDLSEEQLAFVEKATDFARAAHQSTNHKYNGQDYFYTHVLRVVAFGLRYIELIPKENWHIVIAMLLNHDTIEDCRLTYNDVKDALGVEVADGVYALSNEKGRNRKERANEKYYTGIRETTYAVFVKLADRMGNVSFGIEHGGNMVSGYRKEQPQFEARLSNSFDGIDYSKMFNDLNAMIFGENDLYKIDLTIFLSRPELTEAITEHRKKTSLEQRLKNHLLGNYYRGETQHDKDDIQGSFEYADTETQNLMKIVSKWVEDCLPE